MAIVRTILMVLVWVWCHQLSVCERQVHKSLLNAIRPKSSGSVARGFKRESRFDQAEVDLRGHRIFTSDPQLDCCPTVTELSGRLTGINPHGIVLELFHTHNFTQSFYETLCDPRIKDAHCQYVDERWRAQSRCVQQFTYVYAIGRTFGAWHERFRMDYVRIATGCKCQLSPVQQQQQQPMPERAMPPRQRRKAAAATASSPPSSLANNVVAKTKKRGSTATASASSSSSSSSSSSVFSSSSSLSSPLLAWSALSTNRRQYADDRPD